MTSLLQDNDGDADDQLWLAIDVGTTNTYVCTLAVSKIRKIMFQNR